MSEASPKKEFALAGLKSLAGNLAKLDQVATEGRVLELDPSQVVPSLQVRTSFIEIEELADSIKQGGQHTPITVGPMDTDTGKYPLLMGERRWRAVQLIPGLKIRCIVDASQRSAADLIKAQVTENEQRNGLLPHEVGIAIQRYKEARLADGVKLTYPQIATEWSKPLHYINVHAGLTDLPECILSLITNNITRDSEMLFSLKTLHKLEPETCEKFIAEAKDQPDLLTRATARNMAREAKARATQQENGGNATGGLNGNAGAEKQSGASGFASTQAASTAAPSSNSGAGEEQGSAGAEAVAAGQVDVGGTGRSAEPSKGSESGQAQGAPQEKSRPKSVTRDIDANRIVIAVNIVREETTKGLLLVNKVVDGQPGKCVVEITKQGKQTELIVDTDCIEIVTMAELAAIE
ncbi:ParB/RepB/Spo0J family partition protein [Pseudomonas saponiphila]|jgi:ParB/RepB/Spo0J family partition protein|uniref:ParB/RepB/Spo0J family partition protein n=1 Tax=Pseudomonas saponiphila TaxID=556534 RepID=A0A1H4ZR78_9PSED|nr:ParB/RepB/Spo0J family partition protein [Pseudomonas saponiphila]SED32696.1 ParB/RepB/Spo0J family partition protein [Pseudomonas saponiphila]